MLSRDFLRQIRRLQLRARRAVEDLLGGEYHSVFKGAGISFEEVREYQPGDDIRSIDWNVTARMGHPFIKRYIEERELTVVLLIDVSQSQFFGTARMQKRQAAAELAALLAFSAINNNDKVGLILCSDRVEKCIPPRKGTRHVLRMIRDILYFEPESPRTNMKVGLDALNKVLHRRAIVFVLGDFLDRGYEKALLRAASRHDLVAVRLSDPRESDLPDIGLARFEDAETGEQRVIDTSDPEVRKFFAEGVRHHREHFDSLTKSRHIDVIEASTGADHLDALVRFFRMRERRWGRK